MRVIGKNDEYDPETGSSIISNLDFDFTERIYELQYYGVMDIMSKLGGLRASIIPLLGYLLPLLTLHFLYSLAGIIDDKITNDKHTEMVKMIEISIKQFRLIKAAHSKDKLKLNAN